MKQRTINLTSEELLEIIAVVRRFPEIEEATIFGSRATATNDRGSDVDIALFGAGVTHETVVAISGELNEETLMPYQFDILDYNTIGNPSMRESILRTGIVFYKNERVAISRFAIECNQ